MCNCVLAVGSLHAIYSFSLAYLQENIVKVSNSKLSCFHIVFASISYKE